MLVVISSALCAGENWQKKSDLSKTIEACIEAQHKKSRRKVRVKFYVPSRISLTSAPPPPLQNVVHFIVRRCGGFIFQSPYVTILTSKSLYALNYIQFTLAGGMSCSIYYGPQLIKSKRTFGVPRGLFDKCRGHRGIISCSSFPRVDRFEGR